ncbi:MAG: shikimate dehydrogenase [Geitlerinemataceae cyanobacterium]
MIPPKLLPYQFLSALSRRKSRDRSPITHYPFQMIQPTGKTKLLGIIGHPVEHSLSPAMQNAALAELGLDWVFLPFPVSPDNLEAALAGFAAIGVVGFNATIPHKQAIIPHLCHISELAQAVGAVNTVWRTPRGWEGTNTDVEGFLSPIGDRPWNGRTAVVLGNGGAARAVVAGMAQLDCEKIRVVGRDRDKLSQFKHSWANSPYAANLETHLWSELPDVLPSADLLVNTTPIGMSPQVDRSPVEETLMAKLPQDAIVYDLIYTPSPTKFLQQAQQLGKEAIDGSQMLVQQGAAALRLWLQRDNVPVNVMSQVLAHQLSRSA